MAKLSPVKHVENATLYQDQDGNPYIRIDAVRASYPYLGTPSEDENDNGDKTKKWRIVGMLPKKTHGEAKELVVEIIQRLMKEAGASVPKDRWFIKNGDDSDDENMHGHWLIAASDGKYRPKCRDENGQVIDDITEIDDTFYGGCWVNLLIRPWYFDGKSRNSKKPLPKRLCAGINSVVFVKDDKPFGAGRVDDDDVWGTGDSGAFDDDDDRPRNRRRRDDDDDDDRSSRRRRSRDDDDDDDHGL